MSEPSSDPPTALLQKALGPELPGVSIAPTVAHIALVTTFDRRGLLAPEALLERASTLLQQAGITDSRAGLVLDAHLEDERLAQTLLLLERRRDLPVLALEAQSGLHRKPALAALDKEESRLAVRETEATLRRAASLGATLVVLRLGWVEGARRDWVFARDRFLRRSLTNDLVRKLSLARDQVAHGHLDRARAALDRLCRLADQLGIRLLVKNGQRYVELPSPRELGLLLSELNGAPLSGMLDLPSAHLPAQMGFYPLDLSEAAFGGGPLAYLGDACAAVGALPAGHGELGLRRIRKHVGGAAIAFRPWPMLTAVEIELGLRLLA